MTINEFLEICRPAFILPELVELLEEYDQEKCSTLAAKIKTLTNLWMRPQQEGETREVCSGQNDCRHTKRNMDCYNCGSKADTITGACAHAKECFPRTFGIFNQPSKLKTIWTPKK